MKNYKFSGYFSKSYIEARQRFIMRASEKGLEVQSYDFGIRGVDNENLVMDTVEIGNKNSNNVLFIVSGTHGVEGFAGSACQLSLLDRANEFSESSCLIVLVHALNPYGFSFFRRTNEGNVDINRNFTNFSQASDSSVKDEHSIFKCLREVSNTTGKLKLYLALMFEILKGNRERVQSLITQGQYKRDRDLFFGGYSESKSAILWKELVASYEDKDMYLLDIHTGLGKFSEGYVMSHAEVDSVGFHTNLQYFGGLNLVHTSTDNSISSCLNGTLFSSLPNPENAIALEFGTHSGLKVLSALAKENFHYWTNKKSQHYIRARNQLKRIFIPDSKKWKHQIISTFWTVLERQESLITKKP
jgi:hypothetical protein